MGNMSRSCNSARASGSLCCLSSYGMGRVSIMQWFMTQLGRGAVSTSCPCTTTSMGGRGLGDVTSRLAQVGGCVCIAAPTCSPATS